MQIKFKKLGEGFTSLIANDGRKEFFNTYEEALENLKVFDKSFNGDFYGIEQGFVIQNIENEHDLYVGSSYGEALANADLAYNPDNGIICEFE